jgi:hypothetical protein
LVISDSSSRFLQLGNVILSKSGCQVNNGRADWARGSVSVSRAIGRFLSGREAGQAPPSNFYVTWVTLLQAASSRRVTCYTGEPRHHQVLTTRYVHCTCIPICHFQFGKLFSDVCLVLGHTTILPKSSRPGTLSLHPIIVIFGSPTVSSILGMPISTAHVLFQPWGGGRAFGVVAEGRTGYGLLAYEAFHLRGNREGE